MSWTPAPPPPTPRASTDEADGLDDGPVYVRLPGYVLVLFAVTAGFGLLTANPFLTAASILVLPVFITLLWRPGETPVLLFAVSFQWLQVSAKVFHADFLGVDVGFISPTPSAVDAIALGLTGLVVLAIGMRLGQRALRTSTARWAQFEAEHLSVERAFTLYAVGYFASVFASSYTHNQAAAGLATFHWVAFFLFTYVALRQRRYLPLVMVVVAFEFVSGIGFFAGFKTVLFVSLIVYFTARPALRPGAVVAGGAMIAALLFAGVVWTVIKPEYRDFLNQGSGEQKVVVSGDEQMAKLLGLVGSLSADDIRYGFDPLFQRVAYVDYFAMTLDYVPAVVPHENGALWRDAVMHVLKPRILFPNKPALPSDSELTMAYTGVYIASGDQGTSISIGYMGESFIDFGRVGMFGPILLIGMLWGFLYAYFVRRARSAVIGYAFATGLLVGAYQFEMVGLKLLGSIVAKFIILAIILRFGEPLLLAWLGHREVGDAEAYEGEPALV